MHKTRLGIHIKHYIYALHNDRRLLTSKFII